MDRTCASCGSENPAAARFCMACGTSLEAPAGEEVRQVTILFADLVGFTQASDRADPEDVRRTLIPFHRAAKAAIEAEEGTLDKFIGDAALGVFGAPVAHADDPVRAVRAGLSLLGRIEEIRQGADPGAAIRVAVETGDAVVAFGAGPQVGEAVAGDVVNTASRMQSLASPGELVVGEHAWEAVRQVFDAEPMDPVRVKGKAEPLRCWRIAGERASAPAAVPFVGREEDLAWLDARFVEVRREGRAKAVTVVAPPGLGKTRLLTEFEARIARSGAGTSRIGFEPQGYDSAVGPFADLLADSIGVDRTGEHDAVRRALDGALDRIATDPGDRASLARRLAMVLGTAGEERDTPEGPRDIADALARVVALDADRPMVLVVEDVHWANPAARAVLAAIPDALGPTPFLLVCSARPEVLAGDFGSFGEIRELEPLADGATRTLLRMASAHRLSDDDVTSIAERAGGNPLFAIEFGRTLGETGRRTVPTSIRSVIAARLDALEPEARMLAIDAAVVGATFWPGALAAIDADRDVAGGLDALVRDGIVAARPSSRLDDEPSYGFAHALIRDEAYARMPRGERARRHLAIGRWLEAQTDHVATSFAAPLSYQYAEAFDAATAAGETALADEARPMAITWLVTAADEVFRIDGENAFTMYERALDLGATGEESERALYGSGLVGRRLGKLAAPEVLERYRASLASSRARGDVEAEGVGLVRIGSQLGAMGESDEADAAFEEAIALLEPLPPGRALAAALIHRAEEDMFAGRSADSLVLVERGLPIAREHGKDDLVVMGLHLRGDARCATGDLGGLEDLDEALERSRPLGTSEVATSLAYVGDWRWLLDGPLAAREVFEEGVRITERGGIVSQGMWSTTHLVLVSAELGDWDRVLALSDELLSIGADLLDTALEVIARATRSAVILRRHGPTSADAPEKIVRLAEGTRELQSLAPSLGYAAEHAHAVGDRDGVRAAIERLDEVTADAVPVYRATEATRVVRLAIAVGEADLADAYLGRLGEMHTPRERLYVDGARPFVAETRGDLEIALGGYVDLAARWAAFPAPWEEAQTRLGASRVAEATGRADLATEERAAAGRLLEGLGVPINRPA